MQKYERRLRALMKKHGPSNEIGPFPMFFDDEVRVGKKKMSYRKFRKKYPKGVVVDFRPRLEWSRRREEEREANNAANEQKNDK